MYGIKHFAVACMTGLMMTSSVMAGQIFVTGHDSEWHANNGPNPTGATRFAQIAIEYGRGGSMLPFLYIESENAAVPGGNARTAPYLVSRLGYTDAQFDVMEGADLTALADFRTTLNSYSAIVVASDHGGMLTAAELGFLNSHAADIQDYVNAGGGLVAFAESNAAGLIAGQQPFGFLPFLVISTALNETEVGNTVTPFGSSLGLQVTDVNSNFSHNIFTTTGGMSPVDLRRGDPNQILSLAFSGQITDTGVQPIPTPAAATIGLAALVMLVMRRPRRDSATATAN